MNEKTKAYLAALSFILSRSKDFLKLEEDT